MKLFAFDESKELIGRTFAALAQADSSSKINELLVKLHSIEGSINFTDEIFMKSDGSQMIIEATMTKVTFKGLPSSMIMMKDISEQRQTEFQLRMLNQELQTVVMYDGLTGISNRRFFDEKVNDEWNRCSRTMKPLAIIMVDIDKFKEYNDHYGHLQGDRCHDSTKE